MSRCSRQVLHCFTLFSAPLQKGQSASHPSNAKCHPDYQSNLNAYILVSKEDGVFHCILHFISQFENGQWGSSLYLNLKCLIIP